MSLYRIRAFNKLVGRTLRQVNNDGSIVDTRITGYAFSYDHLFRQTGGRAGRIIHTFNFADNTSYTFSNIRSVISRYGDTV